MLNSGVLKRTLNESPEPNRSKMDPPVLAAGAGLRGAGAGMDTGARDTGTGLELNLFEVVEEPTALDTVLEIRGAMLDTT